MYLSQARSESREKYLEQHKNRVGSTNIFSLFMYVYEKKEPSVSTLGVL